VLPFIANLPLKIGSFVCAAQERDGCALPRSLRAWALLLSARRYEVESMGTEPMADCLGCDHQSSKPLHRAAMLEENAELEILREIRGSPRLSV
jgi:hypothetical protein